MEESVKGSELILTEEARLDILETALWYERKREGLGEEFTLNLEATFAKILRHPKLYVETLQGVRQVLTKRFPYRVVFYLDLGNKCIVLAVIHTSRNPTVWQGRIS